MCIYIYIYYTYLHIGIKKQNGASSFLWPLQQFGDETEHFCGMSLGPSVFWCNRKKKLQTNLRNNPK